MILKEKFWDNRNFANIKNTNVTLLHEEMRVAEHINWTRCYAA